MGRFTIHDYYLKSSRHLGIKILGNSFWQCLHLSDASGFVHICREACSVRLTHTGITALFAKANFT